MRENCAVPLCKSSYQSGSALSFHQFPSKLDIREQWIKNVSRSSTTNSISRWEPSDKSLVCALHFKDTDFQIGGNRRRLKTTAIPTVFPDFPTHLQERIKLSTKRRRNIIKNEAGPCSKKSKKCSTPVQDDSEDQLKLDEVSNNKSSRDSFNQSTNFSNRSLWGVNRSPKKLFKRMRKCTVKLSRLDEKVEWLTEENNRLKKLLKATELGKKLQQVEVDSRMGNRRASVILEQVRAYGKKWHNWSEKMVRYCILWRAKSTRSYDFARKFGLFKLPCYSTLKRYLGPTSFDVGLTDLVKCRLLEQLKQLKPVETYCSLVFDEMVIQQQLNYLKQNGRLIGHVNMNGLVKSKHGELANRLLCFVLKGLSSNFEIPVSYFLVKRLTGEELVTLIKHIVTELEKIGFKVVRLVADDNSVNQLAFKILSGGNEVKPEIRHFAKPARPLFLSYDYCHIIKNIRNNFLDRNLQMNGEKISKELLVKLYNMERESSLKLVRGFTRKVLFPSSLEKMNVRRAVAIFSPEVTSALQLLHNNNIPGFEDVATTINFLEIMRKWWEFHDISNSNQDKIKANLNKSAYWRPDDERLTWLQNDFMQYLDAWKASIDKLKIEAKAKKVPGPNKTSFLTNPTNSAIRVTTQSTVLCIRYLFKIGYNFVLTRKFSSDCVESLFSSIRQLGGSNDQTNAVSVLCAMDKILKTGIISSSDSSNIGKTKIQVSKRLLHDPKDWEASSGEENEDPEYSLLLAYSAKKLEVQTPITEFNFKVAGASVVAGYVCRFIQDRFYCNRATEFITNQRNDSEICEFIRLLDRKSLMYPSEKLIALVLDIFNLLDDTKHDFQQWKESKNNIVKVLEDPVLRSGAIVCGCGDKNHQKIMVIRILSQVVKIYLHNLARNCTNAVDIKQKAQRKPLSRKILKL